MPEHLSHISGINPRGRPVSASLHRTESTYHLLFLACLAGTLLGAVLVANLPLYPSPTPVGWRIDEPGTLLTLETLQLEERPSTFSGTPITTFGEPEEEVSEGEAEDVAEEVPETVDAAAPATPAPALQRMVLAFSEEMPAIQGGLGAYYINIVYPQAAIEAGIEGRLVLDFIVEPDGIPTEISILKSLHPLCDSAAVRALRKTVFMPGRQEGKAVPVRMRLPVTFRLVNPGEQKESGL